VPSSAPQSAGQRRKSRRLGRSGPPRTRRRGGLKEIRAGVWRIDTDLPAMDGARRRVSQTIKGSKVEAEAALVELIARVANAKPISRRAGAGCSASGRLRALSAVETEELVCSPRTIA
jgi:hypothetical protein